MADLKFRKWGFQYAIKAHIAPVRRIWGAAPPQPRKFGISDRLRLVVVQFWSEIGKRWTTDLLLNLVVVFGARGIKGVTTLLAAEAAKQLVIRVYVHVVRSRLLSATPETIKPHLPNLEADPLRFTEVVLGLEWIKDTPTQASDPWRPQLPGSDSPVGLAICPNRDTLLKWRL